MSKVSIIKQKMKLGEDLTKDELSIVTGHPAKKISITKEEDLSGGMLYHYGDLYLLDITSAEGIKLPEHVSGDLYMTNIRSAKGLHLPKIVGGYLNLGGIESEEELVLPESVGYRIDLGSLTSAKTLKFPKSVGGEIYLGSLPHEEKEQLKIQYPDLNIV
jgi:hypothetical protein